MLMTLNVHHVAVMSFIEFQKGVKGVRHLFLKFGADVVNELWEMGCY